MDALNIKTGDRAGFDWGARTANIVAALWPERVHRPGVGERLPHRQPGRPARPPLPPEAELQWWYQYYFATERGRAGYAANRRDFAKLIWQTASPTWRFDDATFERSAAAFDNPDHVAIVIHNYRWRHRAWPRASRNTRRARAAAAPRFPAIPCRRSRSKATRTARRIREPAAYAARFTGKYLHRTLTGGIGHNLPQEAPLDFVHAIEEVSNFT